MRRRWSRTPTTRSWCWPTCTPRRSERNPTSTPFCLRTQRFLHAFHQNLTSSFCFSLCYCRLTFSPFFFCSVRVLSVLRRYWPPDRLSAAWEKQMVAHSDSPRLWKVCARGCLVFGCLRYGLSILLTSDFLRVMACGRNTCCSGSRSFLRFRSRPHAPSTHRPSKRWGQVRVFLPFFRWSRV